MGNCCGSSSGQASSVVPTVEAKPREGYEKSISVDSESISYQSTDDISKLKEQWKDAVKTKNNKKIKLLFRNGHKQYNFLTTIFDNGDNSLHRAVCTGNAKLVRFLLLLKMDVNGVNEMNGNTSLHYSVIEKNKEIMKLLVKNPKINLDIVNNNDQKAIDIAVDLGDDKMINILSSDVMNALERSLDIVSPDGGTMEPGMGGGGGVGTSIIKPGINGIGGDSVSHTFGSGMDTNMDGDHSASGYSTADNGLVQVLEISQDSRSNSHMTYDTGSLNLPVLEGFLEKKRHKAPYTWQKRWVIVQLPYILWSAKELHIKDANDGDMRGEFNNCVHISKVQSVTGHKSKSTQLIVTTMINNESKSKKETTAKDIEFRCKTEQIRDDWVNGLHKYMEALG